jgi:hypothetical protein
MFVLFIKLETDRNKSYPKISWAWYYAIVCAGWVIGDSASF